MTGQSTLLLELQTTVIATERRRARVYTGVR